jgi:hypothetical protein
MVNYYKKYLKYKKKCLNYQGGANGVDNFELLVKNDFQKWKEDNAEVISKISSFREIPSEEISATAFCDYYKWSMLPVFLKMDEYFRINRGTPFYVTFGVDLRTPGIQDELIKNEELASLIRTNLEKFAQRKFNLNLFEELIKKKTRAPPEGTPQGVLQLKLEDITKIVLNRTLANPNICNHKYVPMESLAGEYQYDLEDVVISFYKSLSLKSNKEEYFIEATGPWPLVTWLETSMMQNVYQTITNYKREKSYEEWLDNALFRCFRTIKYIQKRNVETNRNFRGALFTGRRTGSLEFLLLQNFMIKQQYPECLGTSSVDAWYILKDRGICVGVNELNPVGTHAHELSMVMSTLFPELDQNNLPVTQLLGHYLYHFIANKNVSSVPQPIPMLPDTLGTPAFMIVKSILDANYIVSARQDSGSLEGFVKVMNIFGFNGGIMASEIDSFDTFNEALINPRYTNFGAGGFFGDSPKTYPEHSSYFYLSMAVKPVRVFIKINKTLPNIMDVMEYETKLDNFIVRYPVKLGDDKYNDSNDQKPGKISIDGTLDVNTFDKVATRATSIKKNGIVIMNNGIEIDTENNTIKLNKYFSEQTQKDINEHFERVLQDIFKSTDIDESSASASALGLSNKRKI